MTYEVEFKFPVDDFEPVLAELKALGAARHEALEQFDRYLGHPVRDFGKTDEAFRIRSTGDQNVVTYKGPLADTVSKTRREIEVPFAEGGEASEKMSELLALLGFQQVHVVEKTRIPYHLQWEGRAIEVALDDVAGLGSFVEVETQASEADREAARDSLLTLADRLGLKNSQRKSYLCLILEKAGQGDSSSANS